MEAVTLTNSSKKHKFSNRFRFSTNPRLDIYAARDAVTMLKGLFQTRNGMLWQALLLWGDHGAEGSTRRGKGVIKRRVSCHRENAADI